MRGGLNLSFVFLLVLKPAEFKGQILKFKARIRALNLPSGVKPLKFYFVAVIFT